jgi:hypothetical protein
LRIVDPYRELNDRAFKRLQSLTHEQTTELLKQAGILDKRGNLAKKYRTPKSELEPAKTKATRSTRSKKRAS